MTDLPRRELLTKGTAVLAGLAAAAATGSALAESNPIPSKPLRRYVIEREVPGIGKSNAAQLCAISQTSDNALAQLAPHIQWEHSYVADNKTFCVYLAESEDAIMQHSKLSGFPANKITLIDAIIDPSTTVAPSA
ncbi:MAG: DUF4242 domain-containing protein [Devosia sp.]|nr:DUF4242 domain-containing protein [Devosia sp.]